MSATADPLASMAEAETMALVAVSITYGSAFSGASVQATRFCTSLRSMASLLIFGRPAITTTRKRMAGERRAAATSASVTRSDSPKVTTTSSTSIWRVRHSTMLRFLDSKNLPQSFSRLSTRSCTACAVSSPLARPSLTKEMLVLISANSRSIGTDGARTLRMYA